MLVGKNIAISTEHFLYARYSAQHFMWASFSPHNPTSLLLCTLYRLEKYQGLIMKYKKLIMTIIKNNKIITNIH